MIRLDELREIFYSDYEKSEMMKHEFLQEYVYLLYEIESTKFEGPQNFTVHFQQAVMYMMGYTDMYLILNHKAKELMLSSEDYYIQGLMDSISDFEDVKIAVSSDPNFLEKMLESILDYKELPFLSRMNLARSLSTSDSEYLSKISPFFKEEQELYTKKVELDDYIKYFNDRTSQLEDLGTSVLEESILLELAGFLKNLSKFDYNNYMENIKDLLIYYYSWSKFDLNHKNKLIEIDEEEKSIFVSEFENTSFSEIGEIVIHDDDFLRYILEFYIYTKPKDKIYYEDGQEVKYEQVEEYLETLEEPKVKEKLKYKKSEN